MARSVPGYLEHQVLEGQGDVEAHKAELMLCQIEATEAQTAVLVRIAAALEGGEGLREVCETALTCCQDGDASAAAHVLHSALAKVGN